MNRPVLNRFALRNTLFALSVCALTTPFAHAQAPAARSNQIKIGQVTISGYRSIRGSLKATGGHFIGPKVVIEAPERNGQGRVRLVADDIVLRNIVQRNQADDFAADLSRNVRYTLTRRTKFGIQTVDGQADSATYRRAAQRVELRGGVRATITDPAQLDGDATLNANSLVVNAAMTPFHYDISGNANSEIVFTPKSKAGATLNSPIRLTGFRTAEFEPGKSAMMRGPESAIASENRAAKTISRIQGTELSAVFGEGEGLTRAEATGGVHYRVEQAAKDGTAQTIMGTGTRVTYLPADNQIIVTGDVSADITAPDSLQGPGHVYADRAVVVTNPKTRVELTGDADTNKIVFTPMPAPVAAGKKRKSGFGAVQITHFTSGTFAPGNAVSVVGDDSLFQTKDAETRIASTLQATKIVARFNANRSITTAEATGPVKFNVEEPAASGKSVQAIRGTARNADYVNGDDGQEVHLHGPLNVRVTDPEHLAQPALAVGKEGDEFVLFLETGEFAFNTDKQTGTLSFDLRDTSQDNPKPNATPKKPAKTKPKRSS